MEKKAKSNLKAVRIMLGCLTISAYLFFVIAQGIMPNENKVDKSTFHVLQADWVQELPDGKTMPVEIPGTCDVNYGEWGAISTQLPKEQTDTWVCARSMQQELRIYVGDELRKEYTTLDTQIYGKTSTMTYVMFPLYEEDACKSLRIEFMSKSNYANFVSEIYAGDRSDIKQHFYDLYAPGLLVAILMFLISLVVVVGSQVVCFLHKREVDLLHLGNVLLITSTWLVVESKLRQFIFPNSTVAMWMGFLMIALLPYPFSTYINSVQKGRYRKAYGLIWIATAVNYVVVVLLQIFNIKDFFEIMISSHAVIIALILVMITTIVRDIAKGYIKEYKEVAIGFVLAIIGGICELSLVYIVDTQINGIALCLGLVALLLMASLKTVRDFLNVEKEKQLAIASGESKANFLANMSHEIRTPINVVIGMNEMILRENKDKAIDEYANNIKSASHMLLGLINDVLDFSKIEAGKLQIVKSEYLLGAMLNDVILGADVRARQKQLEVKLDIDEAMPAVLYGDEIRIKQVLNNLLSNAVKYTEKGSVTFSAKGMQKDGDFILVLSVKDTGIGIEKADMEKLFGSFERLELSKNRYIQGTGLGLNIAKQLVDSMGGTIEVQSEYGVGSCFTVQIPQQVIDEKPMGKPQRKSTDKKESEVSVMHLHAPDAKILVVDDNQMNLLVVKGLLKHTQMQIDIAISGTECLQMTKDKKYDLILMDHMMPEPDGVQTLHLLQKDEENANRETQVIVLTANAIEGMKEQYLREGFADYLSKPIEAEQLEKTIEKYLNN